MRSFLIFARVLQVFQKQNKDQNFLKEGSPSQQMTSACKNFRMFFNLLLFSPFSQCRLLFVYVQKAIYIKWPELTLDKGKGSQKRTKLITFSMTRRTLPPHAHW